MHNETLNYVRTFVIYQELFGDKPQKFRNRIAYVNLCTIDISTVFNRFLDTKASSNFKLLPLSIPPINDDHDKDDRERTN